MSKTPPGRGAATSPDPFEAIICAIETRINTLSKIVEHLVGTACRMRPPAKMGDAEKTHSHHYYLIDEKEENVNRIARQIRTENRTLDRDGFRAAIHDGLRLCGANNIPFEACQDAFTQCQEVFDSLAGFVVFGPSAYRGRERQGWSIDQEIMPWIGLDHASIEAAHLADRLLTFRTYASPADLAVAACFAFAADAKSAGQRSSAKTWKELGEAKRTILQVLAKAPEPLQNAALANKAGYKAASLRKHYANLQKLGFLTSSKDGYLITSSGRNLIPSAST